MYFESKWASALNFLFSKLVNFILPGQIIVDLFSNLITAVHQWVKLSYFGWPAANHLYDIVVIFEAEICKGVMFNVNHNFHFSGRQFDISFSPFYV